jgi:hypothetical protein
MFKKLMGKKRSSCHHSVKKKKARQCTYSVTMRRVHETTVTVKSNKYYVFLCLCVRAIQCVRVPACVGVGARRCRVLGREKSY